MLCKVTKVFMHWMKLGNLVTLTPAFHTCACSVCVRTTIANQASPQIQTEFHFLKNDSREPWWFPTEKTNFNFDWPWRCYISKMMFWRPSWPWEGPLTHHGEIPSSFKCLNMYCMSHCIVTSYEYISMRYFPLNITSVKGFRCFINIFKFILPDTRNLLSCQLLTISSC